MIPMRIACDVDDILFEFYLMLALFHNKRYETDFHKEDFTSYIVRDVWGGTSGDAIRKVWEFYDTEEFRNLPVVLGAEEGVRKLAEEYELIAVTGRPHELMSLTNEMVGRYFRGCFTEIHHTNAFGIGDGIQRPKAEVCAEIGARVIIEDYQGHAVPCAESGMHVILFDQPWNREKIICGGRIDRVYSWDEVLSLLL